MRAAYDLSPLCRSMIGADYMAGLIDNALNGTTGRDFPPYDIEKIGDLAYRITVATAGFRRDELEITARPNLLILRGRKAGENARVEYLHQGLAQRDFEQRFELADYVVVREANYADGILTIDLEGEIPDALKPRQIQIGRPGAGGSSRLLDPERKAAVAA